MKTRLDAHDFIPILASMAAWSSVKGNWRRSPCVLYDSKVLFRPSSTVHCVLLQVSTACYMTVECSALRHVTAVYCGVLWCTRGRPEGDIQDAGDGGVRECVRPGEHDGGRDEEAPRPGQLQEAPQVHGGHRQVP